MRDNIHNISIGTWWFSLNTPANIYIMNGTGNIVLNAAVKTQLPPASEWKLCNKIK